MVSHTTSHTNNGHTTQGSTSSHVTTKDQSTSERKSRMSRFASHRPLVGDSMLAYSQRMREIARVQNHPTLLSSSETSFTDGPSSASVPQTLELSRKGHRQNNRLHRRPLTMNEVEARKEEKKGKPPSGMTSNRDELFSVHDALSALTLSSGHAPDSHHHHHHQHHHHHHARSQISFVSASDLFDLVNFSLRSKPSRAESIRQIRFEDCLKLTEKPDFLRAPRFKASSRNSLRKADVKTEHERKDIKVHRAGSPRLTAEHDAMKCDGEDDNEISAEKTDMPPDCNGTSTSTAPGHMASNEDCSEEKRFLLSQPQRLLRHRPRRAKRMTLHRSKLSAIPERERRRLEETPTRIKASANLPLIPYSSSLAAIKNSRKGDDETGRGLDTNSSFINKPDRLFKSSKSKLSRHDEKHNGYSDDKEIGKEGSSKSAQHRHRLKTDSLLSREVPGSVSSTSKTQRQLAHSDEATSQLPDINAFPSSSRKNAENGRSSSHNGHQREDVHMHVQTVNGRSLVYLAPLKHRSRTRQAKYRKLVFLRDSPDYV